MERVAALQEELRAEQASAREVVAQYEAKLAELEQDNQAKTRWPLTQSNALLRKFKTGLTNSPSVWNCCIRRKRLWNNAPNGHSSSTASASN